MKRAIEVMGLLMLTAGVTACMTVVRDPMSPQQARAQVMDAVKELVRDLGLRGDSSRAWQTQRTSAEGRRPLHYIQRVHPNEPSPVQEAVALAEAALAVAGHQLEPRTRVLIAETIRHDIPAEQAIGQIIDHYAGRNDQ